MRIDKSQYYLEIAKTVLLRATCLRRQYGAVIVVNDQPVATGYCGAPRGIKDCLERNSCKRQELDVPSGQRYELCRSVHAEQNAIINAARAGVSIFGGKIYICGWCKETGKEVNAWPCLMCLKMIVNAELVGIYYTDPESTAGYRIACVHQIVQQWSNGDIFDQREELA